MKYASLAKIGLLCGGLFLFSPTSAFSSDAATAAFEGDLEALQEIIYADPGSINHKDENKNTPLHFAAQKSFVDLVRFLISKGALLNERNYREQTPLVAAANEAVYLSVICSPGGKMEKEDKSVGRTAEVLTLLLEHGADINSQDDKGNTALHYAAKVSPILVNALVAKGMDVNCKNKKLDTPLFRCLKTQPKEIQAQTPLASGKMEGSSIRSEIDKVGILTILIKKGADLNGKNGDGKTPLSIAQENGDHQVLKLLQEHGAK